jgi:hypothetical protein
LVLFVEVGSIAAAKAGVDRSTRFFAGPFQKGRPAARGRARAWDEPKVERQQNNQVEEF